MYEELKKELIEKHPMMVKNASIYRKKRGARIKPQEFIAEKWSLVAVSEERARVRRNHLDEAWRLFGSITNRGIEATDACDMMRGSVPPITFYDFLDTLIIVLKREGHWDYSLK